MSNNNPATQVVLRVNGKEREVPADLTVRDLLVHLGLEPSLIVVELNRDIIKRDAYGETKLQADDVLELVHFVGGG